MAIIKCKMCGGDLTITDGQSVAECEYCGSMQTVPSADNEKKLTLFGRANRLRATCDFDKAAGIYESIVAEFPGEAEAYWGLVLCKYGIEYVDDPATGKKIPTCHRSSYESVMEDVNLEQAVENADVLAQKVYRSEAKAIEEIRKGILEVSSKEEPYDIFICYKETGENGDRTLDSVIAQDMYDALTDKGYRVFFSRITLEDKLGLAYEPYIFAALNSAKVMLAVGTCFEYYNAVWVKNEWSRYLKICAADKSKHLIPCYKNLDAYDMPKEFQHLQGQDMGKMGAIQDLLRGIEKYIPLKQQVQPAVVIQPSVSANAAVVEPLMRRAQLFLEEKDFRSANTYFDKILDLDPENALAYVGKVCAAFKLSKFEDLAAVTPSAFADKNFKSALRFADENLKNALQGYELSAKQLYNYNQACQDQRNAKTIKDFQNAADLFAAMGFYKDVQNRAAQCRETAAQMQKSQYQAACKKQETMKTAKEANIAAAEFEALGKYEDAKSRADLCRAAAMRIEAEEARLQKEAQEKAAAEQAAKLAAEKAAKKKKARTTGIVVGLIAIAIVAVIIVVTTVIIPRQEYNNAVAYAESLLAQGEYEDAIEAFAELGNSNKTQEILWIQTEELVNAEEYEAAQEILTMLIEDYADTTAQEKSKELYYAEGVSGFEQGKYGIAIRCFNEIPGYKDTDQLLQEATYLRKKASYEAGIAKLNDKSNEYIDDVLNLFQAADNYEDAADYVTYCEALILAEDDLFAAEELLRQIPEDIADTAKLLGYIENYKKWNQTYVCTDYYTEHSRNTQLYDHAKLYLRYMHDHINDEWYLAIGVDVWSESGYDTSYLDYDDVVTEDTILSNSFSYTSGSPENGFWDEISVSTSQIVIKEIHYNDTFDFNEIDTYVYTAE